MLKKENWSSCWNASEDNNNSKIKQVEIVFRFSCDLQLNKTNYIAVMKS